MPLICLIGRHGSGKSTIGSTMRRYGFVHFSIGALRRLARHNRFPSDVPFSLMARLKRLPAGEPLPVSLAEALIDHAMSFEKCVLDGFPASIEHLALLPRAVIIGVVWAPRAVCEARLVKRASESVRQWTPGRESAREASLASVMWEARTRYPTVLIRNAAEASEIGEVTSQFVIDRLKLGG